MESEIIPQGVVAVLVSKEGRPIVNAADFNLGKPGGFTQEEAQKIRVKSSLAMKAVHVLASPVLSDAIERYDAERILDKMCRNGGRVAFIEVGYDD
jgi:hypothetical protein